ncbi:hypothetical protein MJO28_000098 [Puccinia striiformis f. sp. tritici]|uniref:Uncharacterized protein n=3 Tax=Puccinia striiformis TaxID=27350 RepID=A0A0L0V1I7_9BASI|nr:hypothetical protein Pst134EA_001105 [Puccinia striiformis f. sp. tritici]KAI9625991.1 hypothetical protein H4Q26_015979 [Puccinia striiformis f. sp. tritici PST-130]KNE92874.1 hypothetical protein PSTG_13723 [Puccinia striiformis f. sp. tritici PST-78]POV99262.1 hypothetical protein PSHT_13743 [Puccinia striiformis]KAH9467330.1 hypothetical protein Pst134EB_002349 [Puccinia striiformis f. sp. tritici]KAH9474054.1 hypothetical protein Pst134EA_001105 [Puccinia striiformis f. sp. tritici]
MQDISSMLHSEHSHQVLGSVIEAFTNLLSKCYSIRRSPPNREYPSIDQPGVPQGAILQLHSYILPKLRSHIVVLSHLTDPNDLMNNLGSQLDLISEVQSNLVIL